MLPIMVQSLSCHMRRVDNSESTRRPIQIRPEQPTPSLQNCHAQSLKTAKHFSELPTYLASFSVTHLANSLKLAKFSVTERTASQVFLGLVKQDCLQAGCHCSRKINNVNALKRYRKLKQRC